MTALQCKDKYGQTNEFDYTVQDKNGEWVFRVRPIGTPESDFFQLTVTEINADSVYVSMMANNHYPPVSGKGIGDALIPVVAHTLKKTVQSSPRTGPTPDIRRTEDADKVWERLVAEGLARFDQVADVYHLI